MRILLIATNLKTGGASVGANNLVISLESAGHEVIKIDKFTRKGLVGVFFDVFRKIERLLEKTLIKSTSADAHFVNIFPSTISLIDLVKEYKPDILQLGFVAGGVVNLKELSCLNIPIVIRVSDFWPFLGPYHFPKFKKNRKITESSYKVKLIDKIFNFSFKPLELDNVNVVCPSKWTKELIEFNSITNVESLLYIPNAVEIKDNIEKTSQPINRLVIISMNLQDNRKGVEQFINFILKASEHLKEKWFIELIGMNGEKFEKKYNNTSKLIDIKAKGLLSKQEINDLIVNSSYSVCSSIYDNSPNTITEAFSIKTPVICNSGSGGDSYVIDSFNGILHDFSDYSIENVKSFVDKLVNYDCLELGYNAYSHCSFNYSYNVVGQKYSDLYNYLLSKKCK